MIRKALINAAKQAQPKPSRARLRKQTRRDNRALDAINSSGAHDQGGLASYAELEAAGMFTKGPTALPVGSAFGRVIYDNTDGPIALASRPGGGKGTCVGFPILAEWDHSSLILDIDGEYARGVSDYRRSLGHEQIFINMHAMFGFPGACINPFERVKQLMAEDRQHEAISAARGCAHLLLPETPQSKGKNDAWVDNGARRGIAMALCYLGKDVPEQCTLAGLLALMSGDIPEMLDAIGLGSTSTYAIGEATSLRKEYSSEAVKQVVWKIEKIVEALVIVQPGSAYDIATRRSSFDPKRLKSASKPVDVYFIIDGSKLESDSTFIALIMSYIIEQVANGSGDRPFLVLADEFSQIAKSRVLIKAMRAYRKRKIRVVTMTQGRQSTIDRYGPNLAHDIEDMASTRIWIDPPYKPARELSEKAGFRTEISRNMSSGPDGRVSSSFSETRQPCLPVSELTSGSGALEGKMVIEHSAVPGIILADKTPWWETYPYAEQLSDAYRDDFFVYTPPPVRLSNSDARAVLGGITGPLSRSELSKRAALAAVTFPKELVEAATKALEPLATQGIAS